MSGIMWMEDRGDEESRDEMGSFSAFKSMLDVEEDEWNMAGNSGGMQGHPQHFDARDLAFSHNLLLNQVDSSSSCSPSTSVFNSLDPSQLHFYMPPDPRPPSSSLLNVASGAPLADNAFDLGCESEFLDTHVTDLANKGSGFLTNFADLSSNGHMCTDDLSSDQRFSTMAHLLPSTQNVVGFRGFEEASSVGVGGCLLLNRSKLLRPLETFPPVGEQPTLFQKRAAFRKHLADKDGGNFGVLGLELNKGKGQEKVAMRRNNSNGDSVDEPSIGGSGLNYDSDDLIESYRMEEGWKKGGNSSNANCTVTEGDEKGKKKGLPAKNLMAERRRRKKLNDRLYMLRSVVPRISKMDRASILGDAIEYLKELLQKINDLHNELESAPTGSALTPTASFHPLTPTLPSLPCRIKEELCSSSMPSPTGQQSARVEVRAREGRAVYIHMFCGRKPGLLLSTMRALDELGLDIQQAVISCFNGFALDIFQAEQCKEGQDVHPDQIKAALLDSAGFHGML